MKATDNYVKEIYDLWPSLLIGSPAGSIDKIIYAMNQVGYVPKAEHFPSAYRPRSTDPKALRRHCRVYLNEAVFQDMMIYIKTRWDPIEKKVVGDPEAIDLPTPEEISDVELPPAGEPKKPKKRVKKAEEVKVEPDSDPEPVTQRSKPDSTQHQDWGTW